MTQSPSRNIVSGPSKFDLMTAVFVWKPERHKVQFSTDTNMVLSAVIDSVSAEDGSGESWNISGRVEPSDEKTRDALSRQGRGENGDVIRFRAYFSTSVRKGWIAFLEKGYGLR